MKKVKILMVLAWILIMTSSAFAVSNLSVSGITGTYVAANGIYVFQSVDGNGYNIWKHQSANYYIHEYYDGIQPWWLIDNDTDGENGQLFHDDQGGSSTPTANVVWLADLGAGSPAVAYYSVNPEINISGNGASIVSDDNSPTFSDYTKFGSALPNSGTATRTFTIQNTGAAALTVGAISFSGTNASEFTVTSPPASSVAASGSTTFTVTFTPTSTGDRNATMSIVNSDSDENPYTFSLNGYGYTVKVLVISGITTPAAANGNYISQGVLNNFQYWKHATENYYIFNYLSSGVSPAWVIDNDQIGTNGSLFYYVSEAVSPNGLSPWSVQFGTGSPVVSETTLTPEINLVGTHSMNISSGDNSPSRYDGTNFGSLDYSSGSRTRTYTIQNTGTAALTLSGSPYVSLSGATSDFSVTTAPSNSIAASGSTTFVVTFNPVSEGTKTAVVTITNNDSDEGTYTFTIQGDGITPKNLVLSGVTTPLAFNGTYIYQGLLNEFQYWKNGSYYIYNSDNGGTEDAYWYIDSDTNGSSYYFKSTNNNENGFPVNVTSWTASLGTGAPVIQYAAPEINITGNSVTIADGDATPSIYDYTDFGWITSGTVLRTYTIQNLGTETLTLTGTSPYVVIGGTNSADFSVTAIPTSTISAGGSTTFQITAAPSALGVRTATLSIANTDADENPYNFSIQVGLGISPVVTTQAVSSISTTTATGNGNVTTLGSPNPTSHGVCWNTTGTPTTADSKTDNGSKSSTGSFTAAMTSLIPNTLYYARAFVTNNVATTYGSQVTFTTSVALPTATTNAAASITTTGATLNGLVNANNASTAVTFDYGLTTSYGTNVNATPSLVTGTSATSVSCTLTGLIPNSTYHYRVNGVNAAGNTNGLDATFSTPASTNSTWTGTGNWSTAGNWSNGLPGTITSVTVSSGTCTFDIDATVSSLTVTSGGAINISSGKTLTISGNLTLKSEAIGTASLINDGALTVNGTISAERFMTNGKWHLVTPIASGQTVAAFLAANTNIPTSGSNRGMMDYNTLGNIWNAYYPATSAAGTMDAGKGYSTRITTTDGTISFTGSLASGTKTVALSTSGEGWNCVGNPYPSAINMNTTAHATDNFITLNSDNLDPSFACVYVWDEDATYTGQNCYKVISNSGFSSTKTILDQNYVVPGQGFFVKAKTGTSTISFTTALQSHQASTSLRATATSWPGIALNAESSKASSSAIITFNANMTNGLDPTYDAGLLRGTNGLSLYTRLLEDNGVDFAIQCLPENYNNLIIPVGLDCKDGGEITLSAETIDFPSVYNVILEDRTTRTMTSLTDGATYKTTVSAGSISVGRFYIHTSDNFTTGTSERTSAIEILKAYTLKGAIIIEGEVNDQAVATLFNLQGLKVLEHSLKKGLSNALPCPDLQNGIYLLKIQHDGVTVTKKLIKK
jgi:hypothetical protein